MAKDSIPQIASAIVGLIFLIYLISYLSTELGSNPFISPSLFIAVLVLLLSIFIVEIVRKLKGLF